MKKTNSTLKSSGSGSSNLKKLIIIKKKNIKKKVRFSKDNDLKIRNGSLSKDTEAQH